MILKQLVIQNFGPFSIPVTLQIESGVTVVTGQNDTGKSSILRLIDLLFSGGVAAEDDVNVDRFFSAREHWKRDTEVQCTATFELGRNPTDYVNFSPDGVDEIDVIYKFAPELGRAWQVVETRSGASHARPRQYFAKAMPRVLFLPLEYEINSTINTASLNPLETQFLSLAFGSNIAKLEGVSGGVLRREMRKGNERLNARLQKIMPPSMDLEFVIDLIKTNPLSFSVHLLDRHGGETYLHVRGSGLRKIITLIVGLLFINPTDEHVLILFDEPENSLHADTQHMLRTFFEDLATRDTVQIIYTTHSPAMINSVRPDGVRLLERANVRGKATSIIQNRPIGENFQPVRASLGISPADSLLYAPLTVVVEGPTEILGLAFLLLRLQQAGMTGFEKVDRMLASSHFVDGEGDSFVYWLRLAKSQGCKAMLFVDGDKIRRVRQLKLDQKHPDVPVVTLPEGKEFEDIVPRKTYFQALASRSSVQDAYEAFTTWEQSASLPEQMMFTKRIDKWLQETSPETIYDKPAVMKQAIELVDPSQIDVEPFQRMVAEMATLLGM